MRCAFVVAVCLAACAHQVSVVDPGGRKLAIAPEVCLYSPYPWYSFGVPQEASGDSWLILGPSEATPGRLVGWIGPLYDRGTYAFAVGGYQAGDSLEAEWYDGLGGQTYRLAFRGDSAIGTGIWTTDQVALVDSVWHRVEIAVEVRALRVPCVNAPKRPGAT